MTPRASRTSAEPVEPDMARLPCLATATPAPATTKAAVVEMLKLPEPSPPVPQVSTTSPSTDTWRDFSRITRAIPVISSTVSPLIRSAVKKDPTWADVASPVIISFMAAVAWSALSDSPSTSICIASCIIIGLLNRQYQRACRGSFAECPFRPWSLSTPGGTGFPQSGTPCGGLP